MFQQTETHRVFNIRSCLLSLLKPRVSIELLHSPSGNQITNCRSQKCASIKRRWLDVYFNKRTKIKSLKCNYWLKSLELYAFTHLRIYAFTHPPTSAWEDASHVCVGGCECMHADNKNAGFFAKPVFCVYSVDFRELNGHWNKRIDGQVCG